ncbi:cytochrome P450 family protein [Saccharothrix xinjiangensis]|uniref:Cytochrome P450 n=1 Tax=Saccharothrix xinjiangensis TaxID=204798 RepID=A0ABV9Y7H7_9PSEU
MLTQPPLTTAPEQAPDHVLGAHLQQSRGLQWLHAANGDPHARLLCGLDDSADELHREIRDRGPLWRSLTGSWVTASHAVAAEVLADPVFEQGVDPVQHVLPAMSFDPGEPRLAPDAVHALLPRARQVCDALLGPVGAEFDLITDFATPAATAVAAAVLGIPDDRHDAFARCCRDLAVVPDGVLTAQPLDVVRRAQRASAELAGTLAEGDRRLGLLLATVTVPLMANLTAQCVVSLLQHPDQAWGDDAVEETLRHRPPWRIESRVAGRDVTLAGRDLPAGAHVAVLLAAAGRDPAVFTEPDSFLVGRPDVDRHLALTGGAHLTAGAHLVRAHARTAVASLRDRRPGLRFAGPVRRTRRTGVTDGLVSAPVRT